SESFQGMVRQTSSFGGRTSLCSLLNSSSVRLLTAGSVAFSVRVAVPKPITANVRNTADKILCTDINMAVHAPFVLNPPTGWPFPYRLWFLSFRLSIYLIPLISRWPAESVGKVFLRSGSPANSLTFSLHVAVQRVPLLAELISEGGASHCKLRKNANKSRNSPRGRGRSRPSGIRYVRPPPNSSIFSLAT